ncbi:MAG: RyR domain-containing protein [Christensenellales bacterium]
MKESNLTRYISKFFSELQIASDKQGSMLRESLEHSILAFLADETKDTAFDVYKIFFGTYRIVLDGSKNPFLDLLDVLSAYEERAATLIDKQRDHYIHSVNVFILGLCIYAQNSKFRDTFEKVVLDVDKYPENFHTKHEEFFFRWGLASMFHDVGYPVEIIGRQMESFLMFATNADHDNKRGKIKAHLEFENFRRLNSIAEIVPKKDFIKEFYKQNESSVYIDLMQPVDLLAQKIHLTLGIPIEDIKNKLDTFTADMAKHGFIDHGFYSAIIVLKWYGYLIQITGENPMRFFNATVDSACAILLHNYYRNVLQKQFECGPLDAEKYPIAYLLMFCDEMQDWNRAGYGVIEKFRTQAASANILIDEDTFEITYVAERGIFKQQFIDDKVKLYNGLLNIGGIFTNGLNIRCDTLEDVFIEARSDRTVPRPVLENMELLAREIHNQYIAGQKLLGEPIYVAEDFEQLEPSSRYSNLRQAMNMDKRLRKLGFAMVPPDIEGGAIEKLPRDVIEQYAMMEHDDWAAGKLRFGWRYAPVRNDAGQLHDCLLPWAELPENQREKDRNTARNVIKLAELAGMKVIRL